MKLDISRHSDTAPSCAPAAPAALRLDRGDGPGLSRAPAWAEALKYCVSGYSADCSVYFAQIRFTPVITARRAAASI